MMYKQDIDTDPTACSYAGGAPIPGATPCIVDPNLWSPCDKDCQHDREEENIGFGSETTPDKDRAGETWVVYPDGTSAVVTVEQASDMIWEGTAEDVFVNGSRNSPDKARDNADALAAELGAPVIMVYYAVSSADLMTGGFDSQDTLTNLAHLLDTADVAGTNIEVHSHSHSCHKVQNVAHTYGPNVQHYMYNPGHRDWTGDHDTYMYSLENSGVYVEIIHGTEDWKSEVGLGVCADGENPDVCAVDASHSNIHSSDVPAGHDFKTTARMYW
jgi:hypothetical protein